jgi:hypothetical protein
VPGGQYHAEAADGSASAVPAASVGTAAAKTRVRRTGDLRVMGDDMCTSGIWGL